MYSKLLIILICIVLQACAIAVPVHELEPPAVLGKNAYRLSMLSSTAPLVAGDDNGVLSENNKDVYPAVLSGYRFQAGVAERLQLGIELLGGGTQAGWNLQAKYQWHGSSYFLSSAGSKAHSTSVKYWSASGAGITMGLGDSVYDSMDLKGQGINISQLYGGWFSKWSGWYTGAKLIVAEISSEYIGTSENVSKKRAIVGGGPMAGLHLSPHSEQLGLDVVLEAQLLNLPATYSTERVWYPIFGLSIGLPFKL